MGMSMDAVRDGRHLMNEPEPGAVDAARRMAVSLGGIGMGYGGTIDALARAPWQPIPFCPPWLHAETVAHLRQQVTK